MGLAYEHLVVRTPVFNRNREILFYRLGMPASTQEVVLPFMLKMLNISQPRASYLIPLAWAQDAVIFSGLSKNTILLATETEDAAAARAQAAGYRIAHMTTPSEPNVQGDFQLIPLAEALALGPDDIITGIDTPTQYARAMSSPALFFSGDAAATATQIKGSKRINPAHSLILELISAVQQEADAKDIERLFKRDIALSFKLLRYINSPGFGLATRIDSIRHALSILGYQSLLKWLVLLAATAGAATSPVLAQAAIIRARLMEQLGIKRLDKREADHLFIAGMLSMLDRIIGLPLPEILASAHLPPPIQEVLLHGSGKYNRYLQLAQACEGLSLQMPESQVDLDAQTVNAAHLEAIEWTAQICTESAV